MTRSDIDAYVVDLRRHTNDLVPIARLPPEILLMVFKKCRAGKLQPSRLSLWQAPWITFTQVCHHWRVVALSAPTLWNTMVLEVRNKSLPPSEAIATWLGRTGQTPLVVDVRDSEDSLHQLSRRNQQALSDLILEQLPRIRKLDVAMAHEVPSMMQWPSSMSPCMERLSLWNRQCPAETIWDVQSLAVNFSQRFPALRKFTLAGGYQFDFTTWTLPSSLTSLMILNSVPSASQSPSDIMNVLRRLGSLNVLLLENVLPHDAKPFVGMEPVALPTLSSLQLGDTEYKFLLSHLVLPPSTTLNLKWGMDDLHEESRFSTLARHLRRGRPLRSAYLMPESYCDGAMSWFEFAAWWDVQTVESMEEQAEEDKADVWVVWCPGTLQADMVDNDLISILTLLVGLPLSTVRSLRLGSAPPLLKMHALWCQMSKVDTLGVFGSGKSNTARHFMQLLEELDGGAVVFPELRVLHVKRINVKGSLCRLTPILQQRQGDEEFEITLQMCYHIVSADVDALEQIALVDWDRIEQWHNCADSESESNGDLEEDGDSEPDEDEVDEEGLDESTSGNTGLVYGAYMLSVTLVAWSTSPPVCSARTYSESAHRRL
ncbi:hypothetical protein NM688_g5969 [Phlebia brevispora]|uniref:Uncharacterized protein n=1 Tax=Phlebia brevispora TaxID=194682 RepID=A0ACC1SM83_9APHY|nr:hypothetical protein NM688_g5969 [Phlebia brevispora]